MKKMLSLNKNIYNITKFIITANHQSHVHQFIFLSVFSFSFYFSSFLITFEQLLKANFIIMKKALTTPCILLPPPPLQPYFPIK